jgi:hypothetical protein
VIVTASGFSCAPLYKLVKKHNLLFVTGQVSNAVLKRKFYDEKSGKTVIFKSRRKVLTFH